MPTITPTQDDFGSVVASHPIVLVEWWTGWCAQPAAAGGTKTARRAGPAPAAPRYGWPGL
ncbi:hypothetical protein IU427_30265 [Nocardia beijingensis]|uniref:hypothetical protein n=1 Tax=Nocardia beijingensis TaxID=95162 RepID=UPI001892F0E0|nr:hypothetical protein [Nocardia beijingensis]MBF6469418.1 hypothetical protein [Nocardia beijingensis]